MQKYTNENIFILSAYAYCFALLILNSKYSIDLKDEFILVLPRFYISSMYQMPFFDLKLISSKHIFLFFYIFVFS